MILMAKAIGAETKLLRTELEDDWEVDLDKLEKLIDKDTQMIILNNPNNPTSKVMDDETLDGIVEIANRERRHYSLRRGLRHHQPSRKQKASWNTTASNHILITRVLQNVHHDGLANRLHHRQQRTQSTT